MTEVILHIYDVTNSGSDKTNNTIVHINRFFKDGIGLGGIFHSAVQIYGDEEWSFGFCEQGTGVFNCPAGRNPMYTYREPIVLGITNFSIFKVNQILRELSREWPGHSYDLLSKNCNHFCNELCERLGVPKLPGFEYAPDPGLASCIWHKKLNHSLFNANKISCSGPTDSCLACAFTWWVNRFAHAGDAAVEIAGTTALKFRQAKTEIVTASKVAYRFLLGAASSSPDSPGNSSSGTPTRFQGTWFKNLISPGAKPSTGQDVENLDEEVTLHQRREDAEAPLRQNYRHDI